MEVELLVDVDQGLIKMKIYLKVTLRGLLLRVHVDLIQATKNQLPTVNWKNAALQNFRVTTNAETNVSLTHTNALQYCKIRHEITSMCQII